MFLIVLTFLCPNHQQVLQLEMERYSLSKGADSDKAAGVRLKGIDKQLKQLKNQQKVRDSS